MLKYIVSLLTFLLCFFIYGQQKAVPAIYELDPFAEGDTAGAAAPYFFQTSSVIRYNSSVTPFLEENDFTFGYKSSILPDSFIGGFAFTRNLKPGLFLGGFFTMISVNNILSITKAGEFSTLTGYQTFLFIPSLSYRLEDNLSLGGEVEILYREFAGFNKYYLNLGISGSYILKYWEKYPIYIGLAIKNIASLFADAEAPFMLLNSQSITFFDSLDLALGLFYRKADSYFGVSAVLKYKFLDMFEVFAGYNDQTVSGGSAINYKSIKMSYSIDTGISPNNTLSSTLTGYDHCFGITLFYKYKTIENQKLFQQQFEKIQRILLKGDDFYDNESFIDAIEVWQTVFNIEKGNIDATERIEKAQSKIKSHKQKLFARGEALFEEKEYLESLRVFNELIRYDEEHIEAKRYINRIRDAISEEKNNYYLLAELYYKKKEFNRSLENVNNVLMIEPDLDKAHKLKEKIQLAIKNDEENALRENTGKELLVQGKAEFEKKNYTEAIAMFEQSLEFLENKSEPQQLIELARQYQANAKIFEEASVYYVKAIDALNNNNKLAAINNLKRALEIYPQHEEASAKYNELKSDIAIQVEEGIKRGYTAFSKDDYRTAEKEWVAVLAIDPANIRAKSYLEELKSNRNSKFDQYMSLANSFYNKKDYLSAKANYEKAKNISPQNQEVNSMLARLDIAIKAQYDELKESAERSLEEKDQKSALKYCNQIISIYPDDTFAKGVIQKLKTIENIKNNYTKAEIYYQNRDFEKAKQFLSEISSVNPDYLKTREMLAEINKELSAQAKEEKLLKMFEEGVILFKRKRFTEAITIWDKIIAADPKNELVSDYIKIARQKQQDQQDKDYNDGLRSFNNSDWYAARNFFKNALEANPDNENAKNKLNDVNFEIEKEIGNLQKDGDNSFKAGDYKTSLAKYEKILKYKEEDEKVKEDYLNAQMAAEYMKLAKEAESEERLGDAIGLYKDVASVNPDDPLAYKKRSELTRQALKNQAKYIQEGHAFYTQKQYYKAIQRWEIVLSEMGGNEKKDIENKIKDAKKQIQTIVTQNLSQGDNNYSGKNYNAAISAYKKVLAVDPKNVKARNQLEKARYQQSLNNVAQQQQQKTAIMSQFSVGIKYYKEGEFKKAIEQWKKVLLMDPSNVKAKNYIERAQAKLELMGE